MASEPRRARRTSNLERWAIVVMIVGPTTAFGGGELASPYLPAGLGSFLAFLLYPLSFTVGFVMYFKGWRGRKRALLENDLRVCLRCLQSLKVHPDVGICPECGEAYDVRRVREAWESEYPSLKLRPADPPPMAGSPIAGTSADRPPTSPNPPRDDDPAA